MLNPLTNDFVEKLSAMLPDKALRLATPADVEEPRGRYIGLGTHVATPSTVEEVSKIITACNAARIGVIPFGGGTGLVGGQVAPQGPLPLILSLERMTQIRATYPQENVLIAEAGAILANVQSAAQAVDRLFPLSLASEGSCRIGGNLATNAGGLNVLRYGNTRDLCLGLEVVLPSGQIWNGLTRLRKDNTGFDLRNLMIGSEGALGVITAAALKLYPRPAENGTGVFVVEDPTAALALLNLAQTIAPSEVSAFELIHKTGLEFLSEKLPDVRQPFENKPEWMVLIDLGTARGRDPDALLERLFEEGHAAGLISDGAIAQNEAQRRQFWEVRERIPQANKAIGSIVSHDVSLPLGSIAAFVTEGLARLAKLGDMRVNCFGHLGDGNLHFNAFPARGRDRHEYDAIRDDIQRCVHDLVSEMGGSISAEHGIGRLKAKDLAHYGDPGKLAAMRAIKTALDPNGIMNPGAVIGSLNV
ncbi:FAD-binding oxidoreductase [Falsihalocynthiibacter arcticus]|uniref:Hydroxyacid dehydrogenase n=1 Tax=Falsihalocynthiibacter arcticus TaxID=1579316 RepID=A0A126UW39_9RHOB|nr:FAD-binding oxidoreductase [Falsihalocynthiibacter arcticus]AML50270.1 hydroxyacid dehydrogenase [Falsihalocynthiibacter arcticus]